MRIFRIIVQVILRIDGQVFKCHDLSGHGVQNMTEAMTNSCNTYFIELAKHIDNQLFRETAEKNGIWNEHTSRIRNYSVRR